MINSEQIEVAEELTKIKEVIASKLLTLNVPVPAICVSVYKKSVQVGAYARIHRDGLGCYWVIAGKTDRRYPDHDAAALAVVEFLHRRHFPLAEESQERCL